MDANPPESLVQFENPLYVHENGNVQENASNDKDKKSAQMDDILQAILPPRTWSNDKGSWMQYTSKSMATRVDVISLQEKMDALLIKRQARDSGICAVREDIYAQCFDELIRQVTMNGPERGLLLLRARDEIRMTIDAYKTLYDSSVTFGVRKQLQAEDGMQELENKVDVLKQEKSAYEGRVLELKSKVEILEKRAAERHTLQEKKRKEQIDFLKYQGQHLDAFLKSASGAKST